ncbi:MAG: hypothetical protein GF347_01930 [Candidatus Moranbacteria bacterium]|nr:hypothetical protein [Candidatus Moranbacteria bacterium]
MFSAKKNKVIFNNGKKHRSKTQIKKRTLPKVGVRTQNLHPKNRFSFLSYLFYLICVLAAGAFFYYLVFLSPLFNAEKVVIVSDTKISDAKIESEIEGLIEGKIWGLFNKKHFLFLRSTKIENHLKDRFKSFERVSVRRDFFGKLRVEIKEKEGVVVMCGTDNCLLFDNGGIVVLTFERSELYRFSEVAEVINDHSDIVIDEGMGVVSKEYIDFILNVRGALKQKIGAEIMSIHTPLPWASEVKVKTDQGWLLIFETSYSLEKQLDFLSVILEKEIKEEDRDCIEYIDLRVKNKVYFKLYDDCNGSGVESGEQFVEHPEGESEDSDSNEVDGRNFD